MDATMKMLQNILFPEVGKKALTLSDFNAASLANEDAERFINLVVNESVLLQNVTVHRTNKPAGDISKLAISGFVTEAAAEGVDTNNNTHKPTNSVVQYATAKTRTAIDITGEVGEDTIEGVDARTTIMNAMLAAVGNDMETLSIEGDSTLSGTGNSDMLLKSNDGWHTKTGATSDVNAVDATGARASFALLSDMMRAMPTRHRRNKSQLRWIMSENAALDLSEEWAGRSTDLGDTMRRTGMLPPILGVPVLVVPLLPEDLTIDGTAGSTGSFIWLGNPKNFVYVIQRDIKVEWERVPRTDTDEGTVWMRTDFIIVDETAIVKANNLNTSTSASLYS